MSVIEPEIVYTKEEIAVESERLCRWGAARAGAIVVLPLVGTLTLMANEVYMVSKLAKVRGITLTEGAIAGFVGALGARNKHGVRPHGKMTYSVPAWTT